MKGAGHIVIRNVHLPFCDIAKARTLYNVLSISGRVCSITEAGQQEEDLHSHDQVSEEAEVVRVDAKGQAILLPALCHTHIHLDKCFILDKHDELVAGDFEEALRVTAQAKGRFPQALDDLYDRGRRLITESVESGVTCMRAHVEVDLTVQLSCLKVGLRLKTDFQHLCDVQIAVFAQDPLYLSAADAHPGVNYTLLSAAAAETGVQVVGSAPYVESTIEHAKRNICLLLDLAWKYRLHVDFHLDYNLNSSSDPLIWFVLDELQTRIRDNQWHSDKHICIGHATRLTLFSDEEWTRFKEIIEASQLPVTLVGLPQSDLYMMGRNLHPVPRSTLNVVQMSQQHGLKVAMAVNNVGNAFTPQGPADPLALCPLGVAVFQACTFPSSQVLIEAITTSARQAIGISSPSPRIIGTDPLVPQIGDTADFVLLHGNTNIQAVVCSPSYERTTVRQGRIVARRTCERWHASVG